MSMQHIHAFHAVALRLAVSPGDLAMVLASDSKDLYETLYVSVIGSSFVSSELKWLAVLSFPAS